MNRTSNPNPSLPPQLAPRARRARRAAAAALVGVLTLAAAACSSGSAGTSGSASAADESRSTETSGGGSGTSRAGTLFDATTVHEISVELDDAEYEAMLDTYASTSEKEWITATVTIDGTTYDDVGMRLKGNSSLRGLANNTSSAAPEDLPWLIKLDEFVDDQNHGGIEELVVRSNSSATSLNEAVALELMELAGLASQDAIATAFSVNGSDATLRLVVEHPDDVWMSENLSADGALYKAESTGDYRYRGDDPEAYDEVFDQEAGKDNADLTPLIEFLDFINNSDDATFAAELDEHLDVEAFATYLAMQEIVGNFDDIDGPGNNSYLYYDPDTKQFTVVPWDLNLAFGLRPGGAGNAGGAPVPGGANVPGVPNGGAAPGGVPNGGVPGGAAPGAGRTNVPPAGIPGGNGVGNRGGASRGNVLSERFLAVGDFAALYQERLDELTAELVGSGRAADVLDTWADLLRADASDLVDTGSIESDAAAIARYLVV